MNKRNLSAHYRFSNEKMQKIGLFDCPNLFFDLYCLEPGQEQKIHRHEGSDKIYLTLEGEPTVRIGDESEVLAPGVAAWAPSGVDHGVSNRSREKAVLLVAMAPKP